MGSKSSCKLKFRIFFYRFYVNFFIVFGYYAFWHGVLYLLDWSQRPYIPNRQYKLSKLLHNSWYTFLGIIQMTVWEAIYMHCCATNRIQYLTNGQAFSNTKWNMFLFCIVAIWVPVYREFHFYFSHRYFSNCEI